METLSDRLTVNMFSYVLLECIEDHMWGCRYVFVGRVTPQSSTSAPRFLTLSLPWLTALAYCPIHMILNTGTVT